ncbi:MULTISPECIES: hypothetical protein [Rhodococcus]|uniref:hypothetical protein n=1 Tax=Rhodococcus TaxID=1827 RepID=UPI0011AB5C25|nr:MULTISPECIES: hypothetical protein [Rhodococcus]MBD8056937.1 hypothetical protein [Rhodococcus ruber]MCF8782600.1 hypothetical protein [Rhodococcus ruber]
MGFGTQGNWIPTEKEIAQAIFDVVRTKAVFDAPMSNEDPKLCVKSVHELQNTLLTQSLLLKPRSPLKRLVNGLVQSCKYFKSNAGPDGANFVNDLQFFYQELNTFRLVFYRDVNQMIDGYGVQV